MKGTAAAWADRPKYNMDTEYFCKHYLNRATATTKVAEVLDCLRPRSGITDVEGDSSTTSVK